MTDNNVHGLLTAKMTMNMTETKLQMTRLYLSMT
jgi:hypothetical protein